MTYSVPLIKEMKKNVYHLTIKQPITDHHPHLRPFLHQLETFFRKGMRRSASMFESGLKDYWCCFKDFYQFLLQTKSKFPPFMEEAFVEVEKSKKLTTAQGRGRCFLRHALQHRFLGNFVNLLHSNKTFLHSWYYGDTGFLYDNIQVEIFSSVLKQLNQLNLQLNLKNQSFLDETLIMPIYKRVTLVPCHKLGVEILHIKGHCLVSSMQEGSVIAESRDVCVGDVVDEAAGTAVRNCRVGSISRLLKGMKHAPVELVLLKNQLEDGSLFKGISDLTKGLKLPFNKTDTKKDSLKQPLESLLQLNEELPVHNNEDSATYKTTYLGSVFIGENGSVNKIEDCIEVMLGYIKKNGSGTGRGSGGGSGGSGGGGSGRGGCGCGSGGCSCGTDSSGGGGTTNGKEVMKKDDKGYVEYLHTDNLYYRVKPHRIEALVHLGETEFSLHNNQKTFLTASYTGISACGRVHDGALLFTCFIGETTCTIASEFVAHVFKAASASDAKIILCTIAQGFERTHWYV